jgi:TPR repeat protein
MKKVFVSLMFALSCTVQAAPQGTPVLMTEMEYSHEYEIALKQIKYKDKGKAFDTLLKYAKYGEKVAQYMVGNFYLSGTGTEVNVQEGLVWMGVALEQRTEEWQDAFDKLTKNLTPEQMAHLNKLIEERKAMYGARAQFVTCSIQAAVTGSNRRYHVCTKNVDSIKRVTVVKYDEEKVVTQ